MGIADGMKSITEGIIASHEARMIGARERRNAVNELVSNARKTVRHFAIDRKHMGEGQAKALADYVETLRADVTKLRKVTAGMMKGFQKDHAAMAAGIREKAEALRETLTSGEADRMKSFKGMMADTREVIKGVEKSVKDIKTYVADKMSDFRSGRAEMGQELRKDLSKYVADIAKDTKAVLGSARELVDGFTQERTEMSAEWRGMVNSLAKSAGVEPRIKPAKQAAAVELDVEAPVEKKSKKRGRKKRGKKNR